MRIFHRLLIVALLAPALAGCEREDPIRSYEAPKDAPLPQLTGGPGIKWAIPAHWKPLRVQNEMTFASFVITPTPDVGIKPLTISFLSPEGAGALPNINRWEGQLGLPPSSEQDLPKVMKAIKLDEHEAQLVELTGPNPAASGGPQQSILAAMVPAHDRVWFFKLQGQSDKVGQRRDEFVKFLESVRLPEGAEAALAIRDGADAQADDPHANLRPPAGNPATPAAADPAAIPGIASMKLPDGWTIDPNRQPMRAATIRVPGQAGASPAELIVTRLGANYGSMQANFDRWAAQVGLPAGGEPRTQQLTLDQGPAVIFDFEGPESAGKARMRQYVFQTSFPKSQSTWFFRLIGPHDTVTAAKPAFDAFVRSLKFAP